MFCLCFQRNPLFHINKRIRQKIFERLFLWNKKNSSKGVDGQKFKEKMLKPSCGKKFWKTSKIAGNSLFAFVSWKQNKKKEGKINKTKFSFINIFSFLVSCLLFSLKSLFLIFVFVADFKLCFCWTSLFFGFKKPSWKTPILGKKGGCNKTGFFYDPVFCKRGKVIVFFGAIFWQILVEVQKTLQNRYFSTFLVSKKIEKWPFSKSIFWPS